jgi:hypothetical protein
MIYQFQYYYHKLGGVWHVKNNLHPLEQVLQINYELDDKPL